MSIELLLVALTLSFFAHALGLHASRKGTSRRHDAAFWVGIIGAASISLCLVGLMRLIPQFVYASASSAAGIAMQVGLVIAAVCALASAWLAFSILGSLRSAKAG